VPPAVDPGHRLAFSDLVSNLDEDLDSGAGVYLVALLLAPGAEGERCAGDP
jgi:hypothetical protein